MGNPIEVLVLGTGGMLGSRVLESLSKSTALDVFGTDRTTFDPLRVSPIAMESLVAKFDYVINCIGVIKPAMDPAKIEDTIYINSVFPHQLARCCEKNGTKLIHISTDCVYSGDDSYVPHVCSYYKEHDVHNVDDLYGRSKSLGEPENCMVLRTSIIGRETQNYRSLVEWFLSQEKECNGFTNHFWNGITTNEYANICARIIRNDWYTQDLYHIFSTTITKYELLSLLKQRYQKDIKINAILADQSIDRTLGTVKDLCEKLQIPSIGQMVEEMESL